MRMECAGSIVRSADDNPPELGRQIDVIRGQRCHGRRPDFYHTNHSRDPIAFPSEGICTRMRTNCAGNKAILQAYHGNLPVIHEVPADDIVK